MFEQLHMMFSPVTAALFVVLLAGVIKLVLAFRSRSRLPYPPGPKPKPLIGNALDFPLKDGAQTYMKWGTKYNSAVLHFEALGNHIVILNIVEDVDELLEKRASNYSDRPTIPVTKLMGWDSTIPLLRHTDEWRLHRKICQQNFRKVEAQKYFPLQTDKVHEMLQNLLERPKDFEEHNKILSISIPLSSMYGYDTKSLDDPCIKAADEATVLVAGLLTPGASFVNVLPVLGKIPAWVPGAISVRTAALVRKLKKVMTDIPLEYARKQIAAGKAIPSLVTDMLERKFSDDSVTVEEEEAVKSVAFTVYSAASDTTIAITKAFFYYMTKHPEVQQKAYQEIERVVGSKRLPNFNDRNNGKMPYIEAIYREVLRIAPPLPLSIPHAASEDDYYKGYFIPKGATVFPNIWGITHDEVRYPDPYTFNPERFLDESGKLNGDDRIFAYGFGRRICVGKHVGSATVWLTMVSILACFTIEQVKDKDGNLVPINEEFEEFGLIRHKAKFECSFNVRSDEARQLIISTYSA